MKNKIIILIIIFLTPIIMNITSANECDDCNDNQYYNIKLDKIECYVKNIINYDNNNKTFIFLDINKDKFIEYDKNIQYVFYNVDPVKINELTQAMNKNTFIKIYYQNIDNHCYIAMIDENTPNFPDFWIGLIIGIILAFIAFLLIMITIF